jgi:AAA+ superfamily predicted ATPase
MSLRTIQFPNAAVLTEWNDLVGLDHHKTALINTLELLLDPDRFTNWQQQHHPSGLRLSSLINKTTPLIILSGDVGCGKTALARSVGAPLSKKLDSQVVLMEAPGDIRRTGLVGELSARIADTFVQARSAVPRKGHALLLLDEGDDIATSREQLQAHHEDRAGVNALIKELDHLGAESSRIVVFLVTNRGQALDPALLRRAALHLPFERPQGESLKALIEYLLEGIQVTPGEMRKLLAACKQDIPFTTSDLVHRVGRRAVLEAYQQSRALTVADLISALSYVKPTPVFRDNATFHTIKDDLT